MNMYRSVLGPATVAILSLSTLAQSTSTSQKRGLCHVTENGKAADDNMWTSGPSNPSWYYNYGKEPSAAYADDTSMQFVPMLWGASLSNTGTPFYDSVKSQLDAGANISHVLGFNEPDGTQASGGSDLDVRLAATRWKAEMEPLRELGIQLGAPAVTGGQSGWDWLDGFFAACHGGCHVDFIPVHWYGSFEGMMSHVGQVTSKWPNLTVWVTEYGYPNQKLDTTQSFYNMSAQAFDRWANITHYSYFGAFRSSVSNVGPNAAMLTQDGKLTSIGSWYMGGVATNNIPKSAAAASSLRLPPWIATLMGSLVNTWSWTTSLALFFVLATTLFML
ncbi:hypothetical protein ACEQ8H_003663 [Pleosporales sp. CAS-2024a]